MSAGQNAFEIVIAWVDTIAVPAEKIWASDLGRRPKMKDVRVSRAAMWANQGSAEDEAKARAYAAKEAGMVFCYPLSERDPIGRAKADALAA